MKLLTHFIKRRPAMARANVGPGVAVLGLLSLLVAVGTQVKLASPVWGTHSRLYDTSAAGALEAVLVCLLVALAVRTRRARLRPSGALATSLRAVLGWLLGLGALALGATLLVLANIPFPGPVPEAAHGSTGARLGHPAPPPMITSGSPSHLGSTGALYFLAAALLVLAALAVALFAHRRRRSQALAEPEPPAEDYGSTVQEAITGARRALLKLDDARAAIIACYAAMEASLAEAGAARASAETPDELLAKAVGLRLVRGSAAALLTSLFYEARFSSHHLGHDQKDAAETALADLEADLGPAPTAWGAR